MCKYTESIIHRMKIIFYIKKSNSFCTLLVIRITSAAL